MQRFIGKDTRVTQYPPPDSHPRLIRVWALRAVFIVGVPLLLAGCGDGEPVQAPPEVTNFTFTVVNNTGDKIKDLTIIGMPIPIKYTLIEPGESQTLMGKKMEISPKVTVSWSDPRSEGARHSVNVRVARYIPDRFNGAFTFHVESRDRVTFSAGTD